MQPVSELNSQRLQQTNGHLLPQAPSTAPEKNTEMRRRFGGLNRFVLSIKSAAPRIPTGKNIGRRWMSLCMDK